MIFMQNKIISTWTCLQVLFGGTMGNCLGAGQRKIRKFIHSLGRRGGLMVSALDSGSGGPGSSLAGALRCVLGQDTLLS